MTNDEKVLTYVTNNILILIIYQDIQKANEKKMTVL